MATGLPEEELPELEALLELDELLDELLDDDEDELLLDELEALLPGVGVPPPQPASVSARKDKRMPQGLGQMRISHTVNCY